MNVFEQLANFIENSDKVRNLWLQDELMAVYVRRSRRFIDGSLRTGLDIANIEVYDRGKGTFTRFLRHAVCINPWEYTFAESLQEPRLVSFFLRNGWVPVDDGNSFFLRGPNALTDSSCAKPSSSG